LFSWDGLKPQSCTKTIQVISFHSHISFGLQKSKSKKKKAYKPSKMTTTDEDSINSSFHGAGGIVVEEKCS
jgi:hypothetical protein